MFTSMILLALGAAHTSPDVWQPILSQHQSEIIQCQTVDDCSDFLMPNGRLIYSPAEYEHLAVVFQRAGQEGRDHLINALDQYDNRNGRARQVINVAARVQGWTLSDQEQLLAMVEANPFHDATIALGSMGQESVLHSLIEAQGEQLNRAPFTEAISIAGDRAIPVLLERVSALLEEDREDEAHVLSRSLGRDVDEAYTMLVETVTDSSVRTLFGIASAPQEPAPNRRAALLLLASSGDAIRSIESELLAFARNSDLQSAEPAYWALIQIESVEVVPDLAAMCERHDLGGDRYYGLTGRCQFRYFSVLGEDAVGAGPYLLPLLDSEHVYFRTEVIKTLSDIGYRPAIGAIRERLDSQYWSEALSAAHALRAFDDQASISAIEELSRTHWFPYMRSQLVDVITTWSDDRSANQSFGWSYMEPRQNTPCASGRWQWEGALIEPAGSDATQTESRGSGRRHFLDLGAFDLVGFDRGEWGGALFAIDSGNEQTRLVEDNVLSMVRVQDGALVATGLNHGFRGNGQIYHVRVSGPDTVEVTHLTEVSAPSYGGLAQINETTFAAFESAPQIDSRQHVSVFDLEEGVLGVAHCVE